MLFKSVKRFNVHSGISSLLQSSFLKINTTIKLLQVMNLRDIESELQNVMNFGF